MRNAAGAGLRRDTMSRQFRWLQRGLGALAVMSALALAAAQPAYARNGHHGHHHGSDAFFSFGFSSAPYYYDPYAYGPGYAYPPAYAYPPVYAYPPDYGYGGYDQPYGDGPMPNESGPYSNGGSDNGPYCREFQTTVVIDGQPQSAHGTACQQPDGTWAVVN
jgi:hypothetical protein